MWEVHGGYGGQNDGLDELGMMGREGRREGRRKGTHLAYVQALLSDAGGNQHIKLPAFEVEQHLSLGGLIQTLAPALAGGLEGRKGGKEGGTEGKSLLLRSSSICRCPAWFSHPLLVAWRGGREGGRESEALPDPRKPWDEGVREDGSFRDCSRRLRDTHTGCPRRHESR